MEVKAIVVSTCVISIIFFMVQSSPIAENGQFHSSSVFTPPPTETLSSVSAQLTLPIPVANSLPIAVVLHRRHPTMTPDKRTRPEEGLRGRRRQVARRARGRRETAPACLKRACFSVGIPPVDRALPERETQTRFFKVSFDKSTFFAFIVFIHVLHLTLAV